MAQNYWAVVCPEPEFRGLWATWLKEECVAIGWSPDKHHLHSPVAKANWEKARTRAVQIKEGDVVFPYLEKFRFGTPGRVVSVAIDDDEWNPTTVAEEKSKQPGEPRLGRRINVKWMKGDFPPTGIIAVVPRGMRKGTGLVRQTVEHVRQERYAQFLKILKDQRNWKPYKANARPSAVQASSKTTPEKIRAGKGKSKQSSSAISMLTGDSLYVQRAREAFPILVRQAIARQKLFYSALADEMGMPNPRNLNYVLGAIGNAIKELSVEWGEDIPPLQCLVVNKFTGLPGEGVAWFISSFKDFKNQTAEQQKLIVGVELTRIFTYPKWAKVLAAFELRPLKPVANDAGVEALIAKARNMRGTGEGEDHRKLKDYIAANPHVIDLSGFGNGQTEQPFTSADRIDIVFRKDDHWVGVEVKGPSSSEADLLRGLFQAVKYAALREAELKIDPWQGKNEVLLVMSAKLSDELKKVKNLLGVTVLDQIVAPEE
jgi:hypothetical protein